MQTNEQLKNKIIGRKNWISKVGDKNQLSVIYLSDSTVFYSYDNQPNRQYQLDFKSFLEDFEQVINTKENKTVDLLNQAKETLIRCGKQYDSTGNDSERIMDKVTAAYTAITGKSMTPEEANIFMVCLKLVRSQTTSKYNDDHYVDGVNYFAMAGEEAHKVSKEL